MSTKRIQGLFLVLFLLGGCSTRTSSNDESEKALTDRAREIHQRVITIDTHVDIPDNYATEEVDPGVRGDLRVDIPKMQEGGLDAAFFIVFVGQTERTAENYRAAKDEAMTKFNAIHRMADEMYPDLIEIPYSAEDVVRIHDEGKLVAAIGMENGYVIGKDLSLLQTYFDLGGRYMTLAHMGHNDIADSSVPSERLGDADEEHGGLSEFGRDVVREMNRIGIMVDASHISKKAMLDAVRTSVAPIIGSHSGVGAINPHPRNMDDEQLLALKENGGVIQVVAFDGYVKSAPEEKTAAISDLRQKYALTSREAYDRLTDTQKDAYRAERDSINGRYPGANLQDFIDHIDHAVEIMGIDHVGISSDFDGGGGITGWSDASETLNVTTELVRRGYSESDIRALWGGNILRVWREVERVSARLRAGE
jgi:membrane dipeptidase